MKITLKNLTIAFKEVIAVNNVSLTIPEGELVCLLGPSGCGKSTTLFALSGLYKPNHGRIFFGDEDVTDLPPEKRGIGLVFQNYALYPHMTVEQNILFPLENLRYKKDKAIEIMKDMARLCRIEELLQRKPSQLSGGQQQRVAIARALAKQPRILLLDEPLSNLDARLRLEMREEIRRIQKETGVTTIFVTHDQEEAMSISDRLVVMKDGVIQQVETPQEMYYNPVNLFVARFLGNPPINVLDGVVKKGELFVNDVKIASNLKTSDGEYKVGVRPEGFKLDENGFEVKLDDVSYVGRDTLINFHVENTLVHAILDLEGQVIEDHRVRLSIKPHALHLFDIKSGVTVNAK